MGFAVMKVNKMSLPRVSWLRDSRQPPFPRRHDIGAARWLSSSRQAAGRHGRDSLRALITPPVYTHAAPSDEACFQHTRKTKEGKKYRVHSVYFNEKKHICFFCFFLSFFFFTPNCATALVFGFFFCTETIMRDF